MAADLLWKAEKAIGSKEGGFNSFNFTLEIKPFLALESKAAIYKYSNMGYQLYLYLLGALIPKIRKVLLTRLR